jgi:hypothetical protein
MEITRTNGDHAVRQTRSNTFKHVPAFNATHQQLVLNLKLKGGCELGLALGKKIVQLQSMQVSQQHG